MYQVLYRKWRPKTFDDVVGQEHVTKTLKNELKSGHIAHAYLFTGSRGTGKTTCAKILAKAVNCLNLQDGNPCGKCSVCAGVESGSILDVTEIDAASNNGVENIRAIREEAVFTPATAKYRVYIIDEVHMLSMGAFNALLKILEEPPKHVIFILATTEVHKIPVTILSRCQRFDFNRISLKVMSERIQYICKQEDVEISEGASLQISKLSDGALRDALSILDQCIGKGESININTVLNTVGISGSESVFKIVDCILKRDSTSVLKVVEELYCKSKDMSRLCEELIEYFRDIMLFKIVGQNSELLNYSIEEKLCLNESKLKLPEIIEYVEKLQDVYDKIQKGFNKKLELELCLVKFCNVKQKSSLKKEALKSKIEEKNSGIPDTNTSGSDNLKKGLNESKLNNSEDKNKNLHKTKWWADVLTVLKNKSKSMSVAFKGSSAYEKGNYILIDSPSELAFELLRESKNRSQMRNVIMEVTGKHYNLGPYKRVEENDKPSDKLEEFSNMVKNAGIDITLS